MECNWADQSDWTFQPMAFEEEGFMADNEKTTTLKEIQRRGSVILAQAREHSLALTKSLLNAVDPSWQREVAMSGDSCCLTPQAYRFKDIYEGKKKQQLRKCLEDERKQREFHSRPMPNFRQFHERQAAKPIVHRVTLPVTPNVLKNSVQSEMRRRQRVEEVLKQLDVQKQYPKAKPITRSSTKSARPSAKSLSSQSLVEPRIQIQPFNLSVEQRIQKRRLFNAQTNQMQETRRQQQEEERLRAEREDYQKHRQMTTFRARPNPFGSSPR
ncbi:uncharacterized protein LOC111069253 [Drosophila obscura]|uniref:uncharacterized protein LOC111069253 n=1 Tax=Drosophila obscura TaxID=7282 RepID=UPI001BB26F46|nr:uncharacterized protein LOC111069253 [Drosophila obscura]